MRWGVHLISVDAKCIAQEEVIKIRFGYGSTRATELESLYRPFSPLSLGLTFSFSADWRPSPAIPMHQFLL